MTMIQCPTHGLNFMTMCCEHIAHAEEAKRLERAHVVLDDWGVPSILCQECRERALRHSEESDDPNLDFGSAPAAVCYDCISAWYVSTGQGNYLDAVLEQRKQTVAEHPDSPGAHHQLGEAYLHLQQYAEAAQALETAVRLLQQNARSQRHLAMVLKHLGEAYAGAGQTHKAREALTRARDAALAQSDASFAEQIDELLSELD